MDVYAFDRYTNRYVKVFLPDDMEIIPNGTFFSYESFHDNKRSIAQSTGTKTTFPVDREGKFVAILEAKKKEEFDEKQIYARKKFPLFKKKFKELFPDTTPVTAKYHPYTRKIYFYFYGEERYNFAQFVKDFSQELGEGFFIYQVSARDMIKISPETDDIKGCSGKGMCCKMHRPLPNIDVEAIYEQHLGTRDTERLRGRCGKLKCSLIFEIEDYIFENKKTPPKGSHIKDLCETCGTVISINIQTRSVLVKNDEGGYVSINLDRIQEAYQAQIQKNNDARENRKVAESG